MEYLEWVGQGGLILLVGTILLRMAGRKSISQMTLAQTIVMISIGTLLIQPVSGKGLISPSSWLQSWLACWC